MRAAKGMPFDDMKAIWSTTCGVSGHASVQWGWISIPTANQPDPEEDCPVLTLTHR